MASPDTWLISDITDRLKVPQWLTLHRAFYEGDQLHGGAAVSGTPGMVSSSLPGWIAPLPHPSDAMYQANVDGIIRGFVSSNKTAEVVNRHRAGVVGRQPSRGFESRVPVPKGKEMPSATLRLKEEADGWMAERWEAEGQHTAFQGAIAGLLVASRQPARLLLPKDYLKEDDEGVKRLPRVPMDVMLRMIRLTYPKPEECTVWTDPDTFEEVGIFSYKIDSVDYAELAWVDRASGLTHMRQVNQKGTVDEQAWDFGGLLPMFEMRRTALVTPQIIQNNKALNFALSTIASILHGTYARERYGFNIDPPGEEVIGADGKKTFVPAPMRIGKHTFNFLNGAPIYDPERLDKDNNPVVVGYETPSMHVEDPAEVRPSIEAVTFHSREILSEARQSHAEMGADATASAISRIVARVEFLGSCMETKPTADACLEWQMDARLAMAEAFTGPGEGKKAPRPYGKALRANAECKLDPGPITPEERKALNELQKDGIYSKETARILMGSEDAAEEEGKVFAENRADRAFELIAKADEAGMDRYAVLTILGGFSPEEAQALARGDVTAGGLTQ